MKLGTELKLSGSEARFSSWFHADFLVVRAKGPHTGRKGGVWDSQSNSAVYVCTVTGWKKQGVAFFYSAECWGCTDYCLLPPQQLATSFLNYLIPAWESNTFSFPWRTEILCISLLLIYCISLYHLCCVLSVWQRCIYLVLSTLLSIMNVKIQK